LPTSPAQSTTYTLTEFSLTSLTPAVPTKRVRASK